MGTKDCSKCAIRCLFCENLSTCTMRLTPERLEKCTDKKCALEDKQCLSVLKAHGLEIEAEKKEIKVARGTYGVSCIPCVFISINHGEVVHHIELYEKYTESEGHYCKVIGQVLGILEPYINSGKYTLKLEGFARS